MDCQSKYPFNFRRASYSIILVPSRFYLSNYFVKCTSVTAFNCSSRKWYCPDSHLHLNKRLFDKDKALNFEAYYDPECGITTSMNNSSQQLANAWHYLEHTFFVGIVPFNRFNRFLFSFKHCHRLISDPKGTLVNFIAIWVSLYLMSFVWVLGIAWDQYV